MEAALNPSTSQADRDIATRWDVGLAVVVYVEQSAPTDRLAVLGQRAGVTAARAHRFESPRRWLLANVPPPANDLAARGHRAGVFLTGADRRVAAPGGLGLPVLVSTPAGRLTVLGQRAGVIVADADRGVATRLRVGEGHRSWHWFGRCRRSGGWRRRGGGRRSGSRCGRGRGGGRRSGCRRRRGRGGGRRGGSRRRRGRNGGCRGGRRRGRGRGRAPRSGSRRGRGRGGWSRGGRWCGRGRRRGRVVRCAAACNKDARRQRGCEQKRSSERATTDPHRRTRPPGEATRRR